MGLAAPKNRIRISNDPQNTTWANNTSRFGHRVLTSHGWTPGASLGAVDAAHSSHYTAASHSHIRVLLKDDTLGLGAKRGSERPENFGLAGLANVLGRLNGKETEVKKEEERRVEVERKGYVARRYGFMNFVSGGFLVGDKIEKKSRKEVEAEFNSGIKKEEEGSDAEEKKDKSKKRKRSKDDDDELEKIKEEENEDDEPKLKRKKKSMNLREAAAAEDAAAAAAASKSKKEKKDKKKSKKSSSTSEQDTGAASSASEEAPLSDKAKRKAEKRARKEEKKLKKALKKAAKQAARANKEDASDSSSDDEAEETSTTATPTISSAPTTGTSTPVGLTFAAGGRHAARAKYIRQKKMAGMDPQALREIFMIKTPS